MPPSRKSSLSSRRVRYLDQPEIEFTSDVEASGIWPMEDYLWWQNRETCEFLHGHYEERYRKENGVWLICYRKLTRLRVERCPMVSRSGPDCRTSIPNTLQSKLYAPYIAANAPSRSP
ncbi:MAG: nuclear transport factor 2 family protein [Parahaliea sp.]